METDNTIFDDVFRTMLEKMPQLVIPVINEVFHTSYLEDEKVEQYRNEHHTKSGEIITDSYLGIGEKLYHLECESRSRGNMCIRMVEYDFAIALENAELSDGTYELDFPRSCVLYLRHSSRTPDTLQVKLNLPDGQSCFYRIPTVKVQEYTKDDIFRKRLLFFLPFYILRYEKELDAISRDFGRIDRLAAEYESIRLRLKEELPADEEEILYARLVELIEQISDYILKEEQIIKERIGEIMGGKVLELETDRILERGLEQGLEQAATKVITNMFNKNLSSEEICMYTGYAMDTVLHVKEQLEKSSPEQPDISRKPAKKR